MVRTITGNVIACVCTCVYVRCHASSCTVSLFARSRAHVSYVQRYVPSRHRHRRLCTAIYIRRARDTCRRGSRIASVDCGPVWNWASATRKHGYAPIITGSDSSPWNRPPRSSSVRDTGRPKGTLRYGHG